MVVALVQAIMKVLQSSQLDWMVRTQAAQQFGLS
jgi:hypothetical protein